MRSILVVDDEPDICANLSDIFADLGFQVDVAFDGPTGLEKIRQKRYDVALLDMRMPGMDGLQLYNHIRRIRAETVAIIVTAFASDTTISAALEAGVWRVVPKPVDLRVLIELVGEAVDWPLVMIVDDDPDLCDTLWDVFRENGFRTCVAKSINEAAEQLPVADLHVALIDLRLADEDGSAVFELVHQTNPQARTVLITGHRDDLRARMLASGADAMCYKPFDMPLLLQTIKSLIK